MAVVVLTGISFSLWTNNGLGAWSSLLLFCSGIYWIICAAGLPIHGKTSNLIGLDIFNAIFVIPFRNYGCQYKSLAFLSRNKQTERRQIFSIALGLFLSLIVVGMVLPLLMKADSGGFSKIANVVLNLFHGTRKEVWEIFWYGILAIPIGAYLFGLAAGSAHKMGCDLLKKDSILKRLSDMRILPLATVYALLGLADYQCAGCSRVYLWFS
ncbi:MAG: DUF4153 domain-containing protein [Bacillota bacterium]|nr:DUF4153 domain-containing protein [Bacillota bacterium]